MMFFSQINTWDTKSYFNVQKIESKYPFVPIANFLIPAKKQISKKEVIEKHLSIIAKINFGGNLFLRDFEEIHKYKGNLFLVKQGNLIFSKINARHGCIHYHTENFEFAVSSEYPAFEIDANKVSGTFLTLLLRSNEFKKYLSSKATGHSKARINSNDFLVTEIPLPSLPIQNQIVSNYENKMVAAKEAEEKAKELERGIENYLLEALGIVIPALPQRNNRLQMVKVSEISRWDYHFILNKEEGIFRALKNVKYPVCKLGEVYRFVTRSWEKKAHKNKTFSYIEIGSIDASLGITEFTEIEVEKAPSRATQVVKEHDLILGLTRPYLKKFAIVPAKYAGYVCSSGFQVIEPCADYSIAFLLAFLKSDAGVKQFEFYMAGALYPAITTAQLADLLIPFPPLDIQNKIVYYISAQKAEIKRLKAEAEMLRASAKAEFEGEVFAI